VWALPRFTAELLPDQVPDARRLRVVTINAHVGQLDEVELLRALDQERPDLLVLTEVPEEALERFEAVGLRDLLPGRVARPAPGADGTAIYASAALGLRGAGDIGGRTVFANPRATVELAGRTVTVQAAHPPPPLPAAPAIDGWRRDLRLLAQAAAATSGPLIALGDFNASVDHAGFRALLADGGLRDAHDARGRGLVATWPVDDKPGLPTFAHIDHVLVSPEFAVLGVHERELPRLDHRVVVADLALFTE
jgi:endonuclease/exonuclease/phosphatase (EEP) superfamily protein YafD